MLMLHPIHDPLSVPLEVARTLDDDLLRLLGYAGGACALGYVDDGRDPLDVVSPLALVATVLLVPVALLVAQIVALAPARKVSRIRTAEVLRAE